MITNVISILIYVILFTLSYYLIFSRENALNTNTSSKFSWLLPCLLAFGVRFIFALVTDGYISDMNCWRAWASRGATEGPWGFYSDSVFCDYPPGYIYILSLVGMFRQAFFVIPAAFEVLIYKLPAIIFDVILCGFLYKKSCELTKNEYISSALSILYALNPAIWINSAVWGQVDAIFTLFIILSLVYLTEEKYVKSAVLFAIAAILKPQALLFTPLFFVTILQKRHIPNFGRSLLTSIGAFVGTFFLLILPFIITKAPTFIFELYKNTLSSYPYASLNAFNFYTLIGANTLGLDNVFIFLPYSIMGIMGIILSIMFACFILLKGKDNSRFFYSAALLITGVFLLGTKMHERYLFPAIPLLFVTFMYRKDKRILFTGVTVSVLHFLNVAYIYELNQKGINHAMAPDAFASIVSLLHLITFIYMVYLAFALYIGVPKPSFPKEKRSARFTKKDWLIVLAATIIYTFIAYTNLGNTAAPQTAAGADNVADFSSSKTITQATVYKGIGTCTIYFEFSNDGKNWGLPISFEGSPCFKWTNYELNVKARYARVRFTGDADAIYEAAFFDENGRQIYVNSDSQLFDEQNLAESGLLFQNSTYFDEIYHARTAFEHIESVPSHYENTHPPLGKHIIGIGIRLFGMNPFGWRFMGTLFGVLMLPLMYIFGKRLFKSTFMATTSMLLMAFDCMHFAQTRISTIDSYPVFFIILMYFFMYLFYEKADTLSFKKVCLYLALSGISFGLAIASKWIGFYGGAGLAILYFIALYKRVRAKGVKELWLCGLCIVFFILIPFFIYFACYIPINIDDGANSHWQNFWGYQKHMFSYHSKLTADHPFGSKWYSWPFIGRPIWYYGNKNLAEMGITSSIVGIGNPLVWWCGFAALLSCLGLSAYAIIRRKNFLGQPLFISIGFLSQLVPWMVVTRVVFIYHYFASLPFSMLALAYLIDKIRNKYIWGNRAACIFIIACGIVFFAFFPIVSGMQVPRTYVISCLKWFNSWTLTY